MEHALIILYMNLLYSQTSLTRYRLSALKAILSISFQHNPRDFSLLKVLDLDWSKIKILFGIISDLGILIGSTQVESVPMELN
jgi:hypothetical protein